MDKSIEAMKLALEAMRGLYGGWRCESAIKACEEALAEHAMRETQRLGQEIEQEPAISKWSLREVYFDEDGEPISHRSPPQRTEQEPVAYYLPHKGFYWAKPTSISAPTIADVEPLPLYTHPPKE